MIDNRVYIELYSKTNYNPLHTDKYIDKVKARFSRISFRGIKVLNSVNMCEPIIIGKIASNCINRFQPMIDYEVQTDPPPLTLIYSINLKCTPDAYNHSEKSSWWLLFKQNKQFSGNIPLTCK